MSANSNLNFSGAALLASYEVGKSPQNQYDLLPVLVGEYLHMNWGRKDGTLETEFKEL